MGAPVEVLEGYDKEVTKETECKQEEVKQEEVKQEEVKE